MLVLTRVLAYAVFPLFLAAGHVLLDRRANTHARRVETFLLYVLAIGVGANGIGGFFGHFFLSDAVAESVGWPAGNPFQLEMAFANLILGVLGVMAISQRGGFRLATFVATAILHLGAAVVHAMDIVATGNLAPGNTVQNIGNILTPVVLAILLWLASRTSGEEVKTVAFARWQAQQVVIPALTAAGIGTGFGMGFAVGAPLPWTAAGALAGVIAGAVLRKRAGRRQAALAAE